MSFTRYSPGCLHVSKHEMDFTRYSPGCLHVSKQEMSFTRYSPGCLHVRQQREMLATVPVIYNSTGSKQIAIKNMHILFLFNNKFSCEGKTTIYRC